MAADIIDLTKRPEAVTAADATERLHKVLRIAAGATATGALNEAGRLMLAAAVVHAALGAGYGVAFTGRQAHAVRPSCRRHCRAHSERRRQRLNLTVPCNLGLRRPRSSLSQPWRAPCLWRPCQPNRWPGRSTAGPSYYRTSAEGPRLTAADRSCMYRSRHLG